MGIVVEVVVGVVVAAVGAGALPALAVMAAAGRAAREGRGQELLVAPRGARFGEATDLLVQAARTSRERADVVELHEHRTRRRPSAHRAA